MEEYKTHEAYGMIRFSRVNGNAGKFFGSKLEHDTYIEMEVSQGSVNTHLGQEWYGTEGGPKINIRMTPTQFAELITSLNIGSGTPCTIQSFNGKRIRPLPEIENPKETAKKEFDEYTAKTLARIKNSIAEACSVLESKTLNKSQRESLKSTLGYITTHFESNIPFYEKQFEERMDKITTEAKMTIEANLLHRVTELGLKTLKENDNNQNLID